MAPTSQAGSAAYRTRRSRAAALVVSGDTGRCAALAGLVRGLDVTVETVASSGEALQSLAGPDAPEIAIIDAAAIDAAVIDAGHAAHSASLELCQQLRANAVSSTAYLLLLSAEPVEPQHDLGPLLADDIVASDLDEPALRACVQRALRAQALRRLMQRRERRRAIDWLGQVVSHELNNPLAAAMASLDCAQDLLPAATSVLAHADLAELGDLLAEVRASLERIRRAARRFTAEGWLGSEAAQTVTALELVARLRDRLVPLGRAFECCAFADSAASTCFDATVMVAAVEAVAKGALAYCTAGVTASVGLAEYRAAVVLEIEGASCDVDPEFIMEPRLTAGHDGPPRFDPGLSAIESRFAALGGQIFVRVTGSRWRFGFILPSRQPRGDP